MSSSNLKMSSQDENQATSSPYYIRDSHVDSLRQYDTGTPSVVRSLNSSKTPKKSFAAKLFWSVKKLSRNGISASDVTKGDDQDSNEVHAQNVEMRELRRPEEAHVVKKPQHTLRARKSFYGLPGASKTIEQHVKKQSLRGSKTLSDRFQGVAPTVSRFVSHSSPINIPRPSAFDVDGKDDQIIQASPKASKKPLNKRLIAEQATGTPTASSVSTDLTSITSTPSNERVFSPIPGAVFTMSDHEETPKRPSVKYQDLGVERHSTWKFRPPPIGHRPINQCLPELANQTDQCLSHDNTPQFAPEAIREVSASTNSTVHGQALEDPFVDRSRSNKTDVNYDDGNVISVHSNRWRLGFGIPPSVDSELPTHNLQLPEYLIQNFREQAMFQEVDGQSTNNVPEVKPETTRYEKVELSLSAIALPEEQSGSGSPKLVESAQRSTQPQCRANEGVRESSTKHFQVSLSEPIDQPQQVLSETEFIVTGQGLAAVQWECFDGVWSQKGFHRLSTCATPPRYVINRRRRGKSSDSTMASTNDSESTVKNLYLAWREPAMGPRRYSDSKVLEKAIRPAYMSLQAGTGKKRG